MAHALAVACIYHWHWEPKFFRRSIFQSDEAEGGLVSSVFFESLLMATNLIFQVELLRFYVLVFKPNDKLSSAKAVTFLTSSSNNLSQP